MLVLTFFNGVLAVALWGLCYGVLYWLALLIETMVRGIDAEGPRSLPAWFAGISAFLMFITILHRRMAIRQTAPKGYFWQGMLDSGLLLPRVTLAVWDNFSSRLRFDSDEVEEAWLLLHTIAERRSLPLPEIPPYPDFPGRRERLLGALQILGLITILRTRDGFYSAKVCGEQGKRLAEPLVRLRS